LAESVRYAQCVVTAQLQQVFLVVIYVGITLLPFHTHPYPNIFSDACLEVTHGAITAQM